MNGNWPVGYGLDISTYKLYIFLWITSILLFSLVSCPCNHLIITEIHELCKIVGLIFLETCVLG